LERMSVTLSIWSASMGMVSLTWMPSTLVLIGLNSPRMLEGASGLGSQMSMWLGPPWRKSMITDLAAPKDLTFDSTLAAAAEAFQERNSGRFNPNRPAPPTRSNSRRDQPSQVRTGRPGIVSMCLLLAQNYIINGVTCGRYAVLGLNFPAYLLRPGCITGIVQQFSQLGCCLLGPVLCSGDLA